MLYTKTGDKGTTSLASGQRVSKTDARIETYGTADELNSFVGLLRCECQGSDTLGQLKFIQNKLFNLGAYLSESAGVWLNDEDVQMLEYYIDWMTDETPAMHAFVLPAGNKAMAIAHICRTITRRLERLMISLHQQTIGVRNSEYAAQKDIALRFVNRLSDYFFALARWMGTKSDISEDIWSK